MQYPWSKTSKKRNDFDERLATLETKNRKLLSIKELTNPRKPVKQTEKKAEYQTAEDDKLDKFVRTRSELFENQAELDYKKTNKDIDRLATIDNIQHRNP